MKTHTLSDSLLLIVSFFFLFAIPSPAAPVVVPAPSGSNICLLSTLDLSTVTYFDDNGKNKVWADKATFGTPLTVRDTVYSTGMGTHAPSLFVVKLNGAQTFAMNLGIDDAAAVRPDGSLKPGEGVVDYTVCLYKDKVKTILVQGTIRRTDRSSAHIRVNTGGYDYMTIELAQGEQNWSDHVDLCNAHFEYQGTLPELITKSEMYADPNSHVFLPAAPLGTEIIPLSSLELDKATCGWRTNKADKSIEGNPIRLGGVTYHSGVGTHAPNRIIVKLNGSVTRFYTRVGIDDEVRGAYAGDNSRRTAVADYKVILQGEGGKEQVVSQGTITGGDTDYPEIDVAVSGWKYLILETTNGSDGTNSSDHIDWALAYLVFQDQNSTRPCIVSEAEYESKLACATTVFSQPGVRFMHKIRTTVDDALIEVSGLPEGLTWNAKRKIVEGTVRDEGVYHYNIKLTIDGEQTDNIVTLTVSANLQHPVPFMGWLSWNSVQNEISEDIVKQAADLFIREGLYDCGWNTIMMDDWWHADTRAADGKPRPNPTRFPNGLKPVADYVHSKGMRFGLYTDAAPRTCAGAFGSYGYETIDANQYAEWGIDVVKCDYCNAPDDVATAKQRYKALGDAFKASGRSIMLYICEWGVREPWKWGAEVGGACWRVSQDVRDCWQGAGTGVGVVQSIEAMKHLSAWQGVNRFNDADMLCTGLHGTGKSSNDLCGTGPGMTQDEYRTQFALWCMWSSPMALSFDPRANTITEDDYAILKNTEMIALNQDRMGQQADLISEDNGLVIFAKDLENGDIALSVTNLNAEEMKATFDFTRIPALEAGQTYNVRDIWEGKDLNPASGSLECQVRSHATRVFRLSKKKEGTGIARTLTASPICITAVGDVVSVTAPGTEGQVKRIIVSDTGGRVFAQATCSDETALLNVPAAQGIYVVNVVCNARSVTRKLML